MEETDMVLRGFGTISLRTQIQTIFFAKLGKRNFQKLVQESLEPTNYL